MAKVTCARLTQKASFGELRLLLVTSEWSLVGEEGTVERHLIDPAQDAMTACRAGDFGPGGRNAIVVWYAVFVVGTSEQWLEGARQEIQRFFLRYATLEAVLLYLDEINLTSGREALKQLRTGPCTMDVRVLVLKRAVEVGALTKDYPLEFPESEVTSLLEASHILTTDVQLLLGFHYAQIISELIKSTIVNNKQEFVTHTLTRIVNFFP
jgi:hypothetical protein